MSDSGPPIPMLKRWEMDDYQPTIFRKGETMSDDEYTAAMVAWALHALDALDRFDNLALELPELLEALSGPERDRALRAMLERGADE